MSGSLPIADSDLEVAALDRTKAAFADEQGSVRPVEFEVDGPVGREAERVLPGRPRAHEHDVGGGDWDRIVPLARREQGCGQNE